VTDGKVLRGANVKLVRDGVQVYDGKMLSLRRFKDDVKEVAAGLECGIGIEGFNDIKVGDVIEFYNQEQVERKL
jgi:translation initiation factor IF-2